MLNRSTQPVQLSQQETAVWQFLSVKLLEAFKKAVPESLLEDFSNAFWKASETLAEGPNPANRNLPYRDQ